MKTTEHTLDWYTQPLIIRSICPDKLIIPEKSGHDDVKNTENYTHVIKSDIKALKSPLDNLGE